MKPRVGALKIGFIVNPYAGLGGPAALKGSDSAAAKALYSQAGSEARAIVRAQQFLQALRGADQCEFITLAGAMGGDYCAAMPVVTRLLPSPNAPITSAQDTQAATGKLMAEGIDILVFVGGDGTARDICSVISTTVPVLGVPSGVKMHSGVFALTPQAAAQVIDELLRGNIVSLIEKDVRDIDEEAFQQGVVKSRYFGAMRVPDQIRYMQSVKHGGVEVDELVLADIAAEIAERLALAENREAMVIFGTGSTTAFIQHELGYQATLLGVDLLHRSKLIASDIDAATLETTLAAFGGKVILILTAIGGQGHIIGRGNQQLSPTVLRRVGQHNIWIVATKTKLKSLQQRPLIIDSNDAALDSAWRGAMPVITGYRDEVLYRVGIADE